MDRLGSFANFLLTRRYQEDAIDRLHFQSTAIFLLAAAIAIFTKEYGGNAIQCWTTAEWQNSWIEYAQDYCFISSTYHVPRSQPLGQFDERYEKHEEIVYYQWLPFALVAQAVALYLPYFVWQNFNGITGLPVRAIVTEANLADKDLGMPSTQRERIADVIFHTFDMQSEYLSSKKRRVSSLERVFLEIREYVGSCRLSALYAFTKVLYIIINVAQMVAISRLFATKTTRFGFHTLFDMWRGRHWDETRHFPRVGMCDFEIRAPGLQIEKHTVQCVLAANNLNEKIYVGIFWWFAMLVVVGATSLVYWLTVLTSRSRQRRFIRECIFEGNALNERAGVKDREEDSVELQKQVDQALKLRTECLKKMPLYDGIEHGYEELLYFTALGNGSDNRSVRFSAPPAHYLDEFLSFIGIDGVLLFRLMLINSSAVATSSVCSQLYYTYYTHKHPEEQNQSLDTPLDVYSQTSPSSSRGGAIYGRDTLGLRR